MITPSRRRFLLGAGALMAAPSIVRAASLMPVSVVALPAYGRSSFQDAQWLDGVTVTIETSEDGISWRKVVPAGCAPRPGGAMVIEIGSAFTPTTNTRYRTTIQTPFFSAPINRRHFRPV